MAMTLDAVREIAGAFIDAYAVVDRDQQVIAFNRQFFAFFPKSLARRLEGQSFDALIGLELGGDALSVTSEALRRGTTVRYDEVLGYVTDGPNLSLIVSATPLKGEPDATGVAPIWGVLVLLRDVTDEAEIQTKYKRMLGAEAQESQRKDERLHEQGRQLLAFGEDLNALRAELSSYRKRLLV